MKLVILGSGTPNAEPWASFPSCAVIDEDRVYIVDCGPGVVRACTQAFYKGVSELRPQNLSCLLVTHLHSDHTAGLAELLTIPWVLERTDPLRIYGPSGIRSMAEYIRAAYEADISCRDGGLQPANETGIQTEVREIREGTVLTENGLRISAFRTDHGSLESYGYVFEKDGHKIVVSGDTKALEIMKEKAAGADILVHEAEYTAGISERTEEWRNYHRTVHTMSEDLAEIINAAKPALTVTTHRILHLNYYGKEPVSLDEVRRREEILLKEIKEKTDCPVVNGHDLGVFEVC